MKILAKLGMALGLIALPVGATTVISLQGTLVNSNDVYAFQFQVTGNVLLTAQSYGYGGTANAPAGPSNVAGTNFAGQVINPGGFDTYLSLFSGFGPTATFMMSNDDGGCPNGAYDGLNCFDSALSTSLSAGAYTLILSGAFNTSLAEQNFGGTLGDGFTNLETPDFSSTADPNGRTGNWALDVAGVTNADFRGTLTQISPEPAGWTLAGAGLLLVLAGRKRLRAASLTR